MSVLTVTGTLVLPLCFAWPLKGKVNDERKIKANFLFTSISVILINFNPFPVNISFQSPPENVRKPVIFRGYRNEKIVVK